MADTYIITDIDDGFLGDRDVYHVTRTADGGQHYQVNQFYDGRWSAYNVNSGHNIIENGEIGKRLQATIDNSHMGGGRSTSFGRMKQ